MVLYVRCFQGTSSDQDPRFNTKRQKEILTEIGKRAPPEFDVKVRARP
jgi:hypothetical protein